MTNSDPAHDAIRRLREVYRARGPEIVGRFLALAAELARDEGAADAIEAVRREAHRIHGTAGTYGFAEASRIAAELERRCGRWAAEGSADAGERAVLVERAADALGLALADSTDAGGPRTR